MYPENRIDAALDRLATRRSVKAMDIQEPGPSRADLNDMLAIASRVPDHGKLGPWRFLTFTGASRAAFGERLAARWLATNPETKPHTLEAERNRFTRAPVVVAIIARIKPGIKIPEWEQKLSVGAACQNLLVAANLMGYAAQWLTEWYAFDREIDAALGLGEHERVAGYIYIGSAAQKPPERVRPQVEDLVTEWQAP